ncbi:MAG: hydantoinase B/oxoprolinase family protein, partial [Planctomycetaceae bacterium]
ERPADENYAAAYEQRHQQLYGYTHSTRPIEITAARVEVVGRIPDPPEQSSEPTSRELSPRDTVEAWFDGQHVSTVVYLREDLQAGDRLSGPAIVCEPTSTVVIEPHFRATITPRHEILITTDDTRRRRSEITSRPTQSSSEVDPVLLEIFNNLFASIAEQMGITLQHTSFSTNVKERLDYSCAVFDPVGNLVVNAPHIPVHLGAMSESVRCVIQDNPDMAPGDVFVTNDPYHGGSHLPDVTVVTPVHDEQTFEVLFFTASRAHHAEIGGIVPGSMPPFSTNLGEEGVLIRNFKLIEQGRSRIDAFETLLTSGPHPTRSVRDNLADVSAQVAANNNGVQQLQELVARYGLRIVQDYMGHIQRAAAEKMRQALSRMPDGNYEWTDHLDDGSPIAVAIAITGDQACVDFTGTGSVLTTNLNANRAITTAAVLYVFRCLIDEDIPLNSGVLEPVDIVLPECLLNPPEDTDPSRAAAVVGGNVETSQRVVDTLLGALQMAAASQGTMNNLTFGNESFGYYETICGGSGATANARGADAVHTHMTNTRLTDAEVIERRYPVRVLEFSIRPNSGGLGRQPGGCGIIRRLEFLAPLHVSMLSERRGEYAPSGMQGGVSGQVGCNTLFPADGSASRTLGGKFAIPVQPGDQLLIETPGGGGHGPPET